MILSGARFLYTLVRKSGALRTNKILMTGGKHGIRK
nr:MAG TPA: hypothetical protein [Caudoviricetes sp.]